MTTRQLLLAIPLLAALAFPAAATVEHPATDPYPGWLLGPQAYSFRQFTFFEALDKTVACGLDYIEAYPGQTVGGDFPNAKMAPDMAPDVIQAVKDQLAATGITLVNYGVVGLDNNEPATRAVFKFARKMGIQTITSEPPQDALDLVDQLAQEYQVNVAIHNHPAPSRYWNPETVAKALQGRSPYLGACADTGHWMRSGIQPLDALKKLEGRLKSFHLKDLNEFGKLTAHNVPFGQGVADMDAILQEMHRQNFQGFIAIEHEYNWSNNVPDIRQCVQWYENAVRQFHPHAWRHLFAWDFENANREPDGWTWENGILNRHGRGDLWTKGRYGDFVLDFDFKVDRNANSGVFIRAERREWLPWPEIQIHDSRPGSNPTRGAAGGIYDIAAPSTVATNPTGQWNHMTIIAKGPIIQVLLNNTQTVEINLDNWTQPGRNPDGSENKFKDIAYKDLPRKGYIGFQDHGQQVYFRDIMLKPLN